MTMGLLKRSGQYTDEAQNLTYHGSAPRRDMLKHGGQAGRIKVALRQEGHARGRNGDKRGPERGRP
jgi:hypothetical protein